MYHHKNGIFLRKADVSDLKDMLLIKQESWWGTHGFQLLNNQDQIQWLQNIPDNFIVLVGEIEKEFLGTCIISDIDWIAGIANISGIVKKEHRSLDVSRRAFEAGLDFCFEILNFKRLNAEVTQYNYPAQRIEIDYLGFKIEGIKRSSVFKCGRYYNSIILGILYEEWLNTSRVSNMNGCNNNFDHHLANLMVQRSLRTYGPKI